jgi:DNA polymerase delta subunit 1
MIDNHLVGMSWIEIKKDTYHIRNPKMHITTCQVEIDIPNFKTIKCHKNCEGEYSKLAPMRILSFDIECSADRGKFPTPDKDPVIQIANIC